jgi:hypothetical protein
MKFCWWQGKSFSIFQAVFNLNLSAGLHAVNWKEWTIPTMHAPENVMAAPSWQKIVRCLSSAEVSIFMRIPWVFRTFVS